MKSILGLNIKHVVMKRYKSYREMLYMDELSKGINLIIGANGNGKSNFLDSIMYVLTDKYQNMRQEDKKLLLHEDITDKSEDSAKLSVELVIDNKVPIKHKQKEEPIIKADKHKDYGKVPSYIKKYEKEREIKNEEIKRLEEASKYPKGTKLLSEEERLNTLDGLIRNKKELTNQLERMPITTRTNSVKLKKEELIKKLEEIEKAIDMFSRKQVFIKI